MSTAGPPSTSVRLDREQTEFAAERTVLAADRTLMASIRTALSMIGFGFTIYSVLNGLSQSGSLHLRRPNGPRDLGLFLAMLGTVALAGGLLQYKQLLRRVGVSIARTSVTFYVACAVVVLGLVIVIGMVTQTGPI